MMMRIHNKNRTMLTMQLYYIEKWAEDFYTRFLHAIPVRFLKAGQGTACPSIDQGPVQPILTGTTRLWKSSSDSTKTSLLVFVRPFQRCLTFSSNSTSTVWFR